MKPISFPGQVPGTDRRFALGLVPMELSRNLRSDSVARLQPTSPRAIDVGRPVAEAVEAMRHDRVGCLLVTRAGKLVGIFTERDLLARVLATGLPLTTVMAECMTSEPVTVSPRDSVRTAIKHMEEGSYRHLPVVDESNRPVGILSVRRVVHYLVEHFPGLIYNQPPDPRRFPDLPDGG